MHRGRGRQSGSEAQTGRRQRGARGPRGSEQLAGSRGGLERSDEDRDDDDRQEPRRRRPEDRFGEGQFGDGQDWQQPRFLEGSYDQGARAGHGAAEQEAAWAAGGASEPRGRDGRSGERTGPHAGKGPKNYRRSDERILDDVCQALERHPAIDASEIEVSCRNGEITLTGSVDTRRTRRLAEEVIEDLPGVRDVHNQLRAIPSAGQTFHGASEPGGGRFTPR
ncbi:MAG TPA: BON domain-containing protein [Myxococcota bacterium]